MPKKAILVIDYDKKKKKIGSWQYKNMAEYEKARKSGHYDTVIVHVLNVVVEGDEIIDVESVE